MPFMQEEFWVTNCSNRNVTISDLALNIKAYQSVNLLDKKHYYYTKEQLEKSAKEGSLFFKKRILVVRQVAPKIEKKIIEIKEKAAIPSRKRSLFEMKEERYEELDINEEESLESKIDPMERYLPVKGKKE